jgi:hypothetical protein
MNPVTPLYRNFVSNGVDCVMGYKKIYLIGGVTG